MHAKSSQKTPKENGATQPCCKTLRAITVSKTTTTANMLDFVLRPFFADAALSVISRPARVLIALDTGPPRAISFSELVLQRSVLAHAPPLSVLGRAIDLNPERFRGSVNRLYHQSLGRDRFSRACNPSLSQFT